MPDEQKQARPKTTIVITIDWPPIDTSNGPMYMEGEATGAMAMSGFLPPWINSEAVSVEIMDHVADKIIEPGAEYMRRVEGSVTITRYTSPDTGDDA